MKHYALIFYPSGTLTSEQLKQRQIEILEWAKDVTSMGIDIDPRAFATPLARLSPSASETVSGNEGAGSMFSNIVFFDALQAKSRPCGSRRRIPGYATALRLKCASGHRLELWQRLNTEGWREYVVLWCFLRGLKDELGRTVGLIMPNRRVTHPCAD